MADGDADPALLSRYEADRQRLDRCMEEWTAAHESLEQLQQKI
jgi:hypothetical protein